MRREAYGSYPKKPATCAHPACHGVAPYFYCILCGLEWSVAKPESPRFAPYQSEKRCRCGHLFSSLVLVNQGAPIVIHHDKPSLFALQCPDCEDFKVMATNMSLEDAAGRVRHLTERRDDCLKAEREQNERLTDHWQRITAEVIAKIRTAGLNPQDVELYTEETADGRLLLRWRPKVTGP